MKFFKKGDIIIIIAILAISGLAYVGYQYLAAGKAPLAEIYYYSELVETVDLGKTDQRVFSIEEEKDVVFKVDGEGGFQFLESDCPDQVCVRTGRLHQVGEFAACLPNNIMVKIVPKDKRGADDPDIIVGN